MHFLWWHVPGSPATLVFPDACACCGAATAERLEGVPFCDACRAHLPGKWPWLLLVLSAAAGVLCALFAAPRLLPFADLVVQGALALLVGAVASLPLALWLWRRTRRPAAGHVGVSQSFEVTRHTTAFASRAFAERVAALSGKKAEAGHAPRTYLLEVGAPLVGSFAAAVFAVWYFPAWHLGVWLDNGTERALALRAGGRTVATLPAGERVRVELPRRELALEARDGDEVVDYATLRPPRDRGDFVFNVRTRRCYELRSATFLRPLKYRGRLFQVRADAYFPALAGPFKGSILVESACEPRSTRGTGPSRRERRRYQR